MVEYLNHLSSFWVATYIWGVPKLICSNSIRFLTKLSERDIAEKISLALKEISQPDEIVGYPSQYTWDRTALAGFEIFQALLDGRSPDSSVGCEAVATISRREAHGG
jgi:hypothetical protein